MKSIMLVLLLVILLPLTGCMTSPKNEVPPETRIEIEGDDNRVDVRIEVDIDGHAAGDPTKTVTTDAEATAIP